MTRLTKRESEHWSKTFIWGGFTGGAGGRSVDWDRSVSGSFLGFAASNTSLSTRLFPFPFKCNQASDLFKNQKPENNPQYVHKFSNYSLERAEYISLISIRTSI